MSPQNTNPNQRPRRRISWTSQPRHFPRSRTKSHRLCPLCSDHTDWSTLSDSMAAPALVLRSLQGILCKSPCESLLAADLLASYKGIYSDGDGLVDVLGRTEIRKSHLAKGLCDPHDCFQMTNLVEVSSCPQCPLFFNDHTVIGYAPVARLSLRMSAKSLATLS